METKLQLRGRGLSRPLTLFGVELAAGQLIAQGFQTDVYLRKSRILQGPDGARYRLTEGLEPKGGAVQAVPVNLSSPIALEVVP